MLKILDYFARRKLLKSVDKINPYSDEFLEARLAELKERVDEKRYKHTLGVMKMAEKLCDTYGIDKKKAVLAAALHDWDKCYNDEEMRKRIADVGATRLVGSKIIQEMPKVAHGTTAALSLGVKYPSIPSDVLKAVMHHTTASTRMSRLDMVVYVADALDPGRNYPEYNELASMIGKECLEDLFCKVYGKSTIAVINKGQTLHPKTAVIWNKNVEMYNARHKK